MWRSELRNMSKVNRFQKLIKKLLLIQYDQVIQMVNVCAEEIVEQITEKENEKNNKD